MSDLPQPVGAGPPTLAKSRTGLADAVRAQADGYVDRRKGEVAGFVADLAMSLRNGSGDLRQVSETKAFLHTLSDSLNDLSVTIDRRSLGEHCRDAGIIARRHPLATIALSAAAGYGAFHVLRSKVGRSR